LSRLIADYCSRASIKTIAEFKAVAAPVVKGNPSKYFAQVFQALRMAVNDELGALQDLLVQSAELLKPGGRMVVITFHSIEDRMVKQFFKTGGLEGAADPIYGTRPEGPFEALGKKPIEPGEEEIRLNPRSRSARMRVGEKRQ
jgi:16S rRNA (cytosine1402-N4)-methyltransferase